MDSIERKYTNTLKIIIDGVFSSGKTQFIQAVSEFEPIKTNFVTKKDNGLVTQSIALDFGRISIDSTFALYLFAPPGARRFSSVWESTHANETFDGLIILLDSCRVETFQEAKRILNYRDEHVTIPYVVAANKQDLPNAWSVQDIQIALKLKEPVIPCCAKDVESVKHVLLTLLERVLARIDEEEVETQQRIKEEADSGYSIR